MKPSIASELGVTRDKRRRRVRTQGSGLLLRVKGRLKVQHCRATTCMSQYMYAFMYVCMCVCLFICKPVYVFTCVYVYAYEYMCVCSVGM